MILKDTNEVVPPDEKSRLTSRLGDPHIGIANVSYYRDSCTLLPRSYHITPKAVKSYD